MPTQITRRRSLSFAAQATTVASAGKFFVIDSAGQNGNAGAKYNDASKALDGFVKQYAREMNSPGISRAGIIQNECST